MSAENTHVGVTTRRRLLGRRGLFFVTAITGATSLLLMVVVVGGGAIFVQWKTLSSYFSDLTMRMKQQESYNTKTTTAAQSTLQQQQAQQLQMEMDDFFTNNNNSSSDDDPKHQRAYQLALLRFHHRNQGGGGGEEEEGSSTTTYNLKSLSSLQNQTHVLNLIRIPKAGSSSLSVTARALAGCQPDGFPCCNFPGHPKGSCPRRNLMCPIVRGCVDHYPNYAAVDDGNELPTITSLRNPTDRLMSGFFYVWPHRPRPDADHSWPTFESYVKGPKFRNVITKMLSGSYAYATFQSSKHSVAQATTPLCQMTWFGMAEWPMTSALLLYETTPFANLVPNPVVFGLPPSSSSSLLLESATKLGNSSTAVVDDDDVSGVWRTNSTTSKETTQAGLRVNKNDEYSNWKTAYATQAERLILEYNQDDWKVYEFARGLFAARWRQSGIRWDDAEDAAMSNYTGSIQDYCPDRQPVATLDEHEQQTMVLPPRDSSAKPFSGERNNDSAFMPALFLNDTDELFQQEMLQQIHISYPTAHFDDWVVLFVDESYLTVFDLWHQYYRRLNHSPNHQVLCIIAIGARAFDKLRRCLVHTPNIVLLLLVDTVDNFKPQSKTNKNKQSLGRLWTRRVEFLNSFVNKLPQFNVIFSDVDAFWAKDPYAFLEAEQMRNADLIASRGTFPKKCQVVQGGSACFGFLRFRSNSEAVQEYVAKVRTQIQSIHDDDQVALNCVLREQYVLSEKSFPLRGQGDKATALLTYRGPPQSNNTFTVVLLSYDIAIRYCAKGGGSKQLENATIRHCYAEKSSRAKTTLIDNFNLSLGEWNQSCVM